MRTLVLNLTRFGDLLQSQPVIHGLRAQGRRVGLVCLENFAPAAALLDGVDALYPLPGGKLLSALDGPWPRALADLQAWAASVRDEFAPEDVLNLTSSPAARLLARMVSAGSEPRGFAMDAHGFGVTGSAWSAFFEASTRSRGCSPFNIVDVFLRASNLSGPARYALRQPDPAERDEAARRLRQAANGRAEGFVAFQPGASDPRRQWPLASFAAIGQRLHETFGLMPVLLGTGAEARLGEAYAASGAPGVNLIGGTTPAQLAATLAETRLLLTNDTGTMHLAAGLGVPCLGIFLATAQPWDTGPYLEGCCSLEPALACHPCGFDATCPHDGRCLGHITPEAVWPLLHGFCSGAGWTCPPETARTARVWLARRDSRGYMDLLSLSGHGREDRTLWIGLQRHMYRDILDQADNQAAPSPVSGGHEARHGRDAGIEAANLGPEALAGLLSPNFREQAVAVLEQADALLHLFQEQGRLTLTRPGTAGGRTGARQFLITCQRLGSLFDSHDRFNAMGRLWQTLSQERAEDLPGLLAFGADLRAALARWRATLQLPAC